MKKTLVLSMMASALVLSVLPGCPSKEETGDENATTVNNDDEAEEEESGTEDSGEATTSSPTTIGDEEETGCSFLNCTDMPPPAPTCDPFAQDCPEGEKCVPYGSTGGNWDANKCVPIMGDGQPGDSCTWDGTVAATDSCGPESHCWDVEDVDGSLVGVCTAFCEGTADNPICPPETSCLIANEGSITLCIKTCDPLLQDCGDGLACFWANTDFNCIFTTQDIPTGEACGYINDCAAGNLCADAGALPSCAGSACCAAYCDLTDPVCTVPDTECVSFFEEGMAPPGYEDVGVCILPG